MKNGLKTLGDDRSELLKYYQTVTMFLSVLFTPRSSGNLFSTNFSKLPLTNLP